jgi:uncharacterized protein
MTPFTFDITWTQALTLLLIGLAGGILSGMVGVGGGIIVVPALVLLLGLTQHAAQGTTLVLFLLPFGIFGVLNYYRQGNVNVGYALLIGLAFMLGSFLGSRWALQIDQQMLRKGFAIFIALVAVKLFFGK